MTPPTRLSNCHVESEAPHRKFVILSGGRSPESKDLRTEFTANITTVRRSFDSLRSLRMTDGVALFLLRLDFFCQLRQIHPPFGLVFELRFQVVQLVL